MSKTFKYYALLFATFTVPSISVFAQDDIYYSDDDEPEEAEEVVKQTTVQSDDGYANESVSRHANDKDTLIAYDDSDFVYSRRLNRFHDADLPVYTSASDVDANGNITNVYVINGNPYYTYYRPGWAWSWNYGYSTYWGLYDPWWDGYYYRHSCYWGPGWGYYGYYGYPYRYHYGYNYGYHHAGPHYYGRKHLTPILQPSCLQSSQHVGQQR